MDKIVNILDKLLYNNDICIIDNIKEYLYPRCCCCKILFEKNERERWDGKYICDNCFYKIEWKKCPECKKYFNRSNNVFCLVVVYQTAVYIVKIV
jgi:hypothetical protein